MSALRVGTRRSPLARAQAAQVADLLDGQGHACTLVEITTHGDVDQGPLAEIGGTGVFVSALRTALLDGEVDLAVHSLKDLPTADHDGITLGAVPARADARDALCARDGLTLGELPTGSTVGTGSPRRAAQLHALGLGLDIRAVRGNVGTRLALVTSGTLDAVVLARAGLARLDRLDAVTEVLDPLQMLPAPGQGALAVECRAADAATRTALAGLDDPDARAATAAERSLLAALEAGCSAPVGALAEVGEGDNGPELYLRAAVGTPDGSQLVRASATGDPADAVGLGARLAAELLDLLGGAGTDIDPYDLHDRNRTRNEAPALAPAEETVP